MTEEQGQVGNQKALVTASPFQLMSFDDANKMAEVFYTSGVFSDVKGAAECVVKIIGGSELGLPPVYSMQNLYMVKGRLTSSGQVLGLLIKRSDKYNYRVVEHTDERCTIEFFELGKMVYKSTFTLKDAERALLVLKDKPESNWMKYPRPMLFNRALSQGARIVCPDVIGGVYTREEMEGVVEGEVVSISEEGPHEAQEIQGEELEEAAPAEAARPIPPRGKPATREQLIASVKRGMDKFLDDNEQANFLAQFDGAETIEELQDGGLRVALQKLQEIADMVQP